MKAALILFFVGTALASDLHWAFDEKVKDVKDKQYDINELYKGLASEDLHNFVRKEFPFNDGKYFTNPQILEKFMSAWEEGFLDKDGVFTLYSYKNRHDTYRLFDLFYFAKDYETFMKIAKWARTDLHPLQYFYALTTAIYHRKDTQGVAVPPTYEVLPHYYVPYTIIQGTYKANIFGVPSRKFDLNTTGHEFSWYKGQTYESFKSGPKWNYYDTESRMSYYREDVSLSDFLVKIMMSYAPWIYQEKYPEINFSRKGEILFENFRFILGRYNLERYANNLPPVQPLHYKMPIETGYTPQLVSITGHPFTARPDGLIPFESNTEGVTSLEFTKMRFHESTDVMGYHYASNGSFISFEGENGLNTLANLVYGSTDPGTRNVFRPYHFESLEVLDRAVRAANDVGNAGSVLSNYLTEMRDPIFYRVLATVYNIFTDFFNKMQPYTREELDFPGVKFVEFQTTKLETYFDSYEYAITNSVPVGSKGTRGGEGNQYHVLQTRLNHKPFTFKFTIHSDKAQDAMVKIYLTPAVDTNGRELGLSEKILNAVEFFFYRLKLKPGVNTFSGSPTDGFYSKDMNTRAINKELQKKKSSKEPFYISKYQRCSFPDNLALPKGSKGGKPYTVFAIVHAPGNTVSGESVGPCNYELAFGNDSPSFPTCRRIIPSNFDTKNIYFKDITIYHTQYDEKH